MKKIKIGVMVVMMLLVKFSGKIEKDYIEINKALYFAEGIGTLHVSREVDVQNQSQFNIAVSYADIDQFNRAKQEMMPESTIPDIKYEDVIGNPNLFLTSLESFYIEYNKSIGLIAVRYNGILYNVGETEGAVISDEMKARIDRYNRNQRSRNQIFFEQYNSYYADVISTIDTGGEASYELRQTGIVPYPKTQSQESCDLACLQEMSIKSLLNEVEEHVTRGEALSTTNILMDELYYNRMLVTALANKGRLRIIVDDDIITDLYNFYLYNASQETKKYMYHYFATMPQDGRIFGGVGVSIAGLFNSKVLGFEDMTSIEVDALYRDTNGSTIPVFGVTISKEVASMDASRAGIMNQVEYEIFVAVKTKKTMDFEKIEDDYERIREKEK